MKKPKNVKRFRQFAEKEMMKSLHKYNKVTAVICIAIDFFMTLVEDHAGFGGGTREKFKETTFLHPHGMYPCYVIKVNDYSHRWGGYGFHFNTSYTDLSIGSSKETREVSAHVFDEDFDVFWRKVINLMCMIFDTELVFPEIKIFETDKEWLNIKGNAMKKRKKMRHYEPWSDEPYESRQVFGAWAKVPVEICITCPCFEPTIGGKTNTHGQPGVCYFCREGSNNQEIKHKIPPCI